jgi:serralysin
MKRNRLWPNDKPIVVCFLDGDSWQHEFVMKHAKEWEKCAHITFEVVADADRKLSNIRISFKGEGFWSAVGTDAQCVEEDNPTMNIDFTPIASLVLEKATSHQIQFNSKATQWVKGAILHEFGHALGCLHEHSSPNATIAWDKEAVLCHYEKGCGWNPAETESQVLGKHGRKTVKASQYDNLSIMHYEVLPELTKDGSSVDNTHELSEMDKKFMAKMYPKPKKERRAGALLD